MRGLGGTKRDNVSTQSRDVRPQHRPKYSTLTESLFYHLFVPSFVELSEKTVF